MSTRALALLMTALTAECAAAFTTGPLLPVRGLRQTPLRATWRPALRMIGDERGGDPDVVMHRVNARLEVEPMALTVAYFEHAFDSPPAEIPADLLESALSATYIPPVPVSPLDDSQSPAGPSAPDTTATSACQPEDVVDAVESVSREIDRSAADQTSQVAPPTCSAAPTAKEDPATVLKRASQMEAEVGPVSQVKGNVKKWSR